MKRLFTSFLFAAACLHAQATTGSPERGKLQFTKTCSFCHGPDAGGGAEGPSLILSKVVRHDRDGDLISHVIREGRPAKGMPPVPLTNEQIADVVAYLHYRLAENDIRSPKRPKDYAVKLLLTGNAAQGEAFFKQHCAGCHSPSGDLKGIATRLDPADLQTRFLYPGEVPQTATITAGSEQIKGTLLYRDPFTVEITDQNGQFRSWDPATIKIAVNNPLTGHIDLLPTYTESDVHNIFAYLETLH
jgi:cytochrome c oxidase cbb3-type subunit III